MGLIKEIEYFNCFLAKKVVEDNGSGGAGKATWPALPWEPTGYPRFPLEASTTEDHVLFDWYIEEARIRGGYNNTIVDLGVKAFISESEDTELILSNGIIYSGLYNSRTGINETNVFSTGENITRELDPRYGAIQKLYTTDTNLIIFQEDKVSNALVDKDAIYSADGNQTLTSTQLVLGQINQYSGEYGISDNPESFAFKGYRMYFSDKNRGAMLRLSRDGITEISSYGMRDYFRDTLANISEVPQSFQVALTLNTDQPVGFNNYLYFIDSTVNEVADLELGMQALSGSLFPEGLYVVNVVNGPLPGTKTVTFNDVVQLYNPGTDISFYKNIKDKVVGLYDNYYDTYVASIQQNAAKTYNTLSFSDSNNGWTSFWDYDPSFGGTLNNVYYTVKGGSIWKHYDESVINNKGNFYGTYYPTSVQLSFNPMVSVSKNFNTVNYEGTNGWQADFFLSDPTGELLTETTSSNYKDESSAIKSYEDGAYTEAGVTYRVGFNIKDNKYFANLVNNGVQVGGSDNLQFGMPGQVASNISMSGIKGFYATVKLSTDNTTDIGGFKNLFAVSSNFVKS